MTSKPIVITMVTLLVLAISAGVLGISQTAQGQDGSEIAQSVLDSVFGSNADRDGTEEEAGDDNQEIDQTNDQLNDRDQSARQPVTQDNSQDEITT